MSLNDQSARRYVRPPRPLHFPTEALTPETKWHLEQRTALYQVLKLAIGERALIGSDQFIYWDPTDPSACLAPNLFVRVGSKDELFDSWKVWERGAPHVAVDIAGGYSGDAAWAEKLHRYHRLGVLEVVRFDPDDGEAPLHVWDYVAGDLVERELVDRRGAECGPLGLWWLVVEDLDAGLVLRIAGAGGEILPTLGEVAAFEMEARLRAEQERDQALLRVRELEEELRRRR